MVTRETAQRLVDFLVEQRLVPILYALAGRGVDGQVKNPKVSTRRHGPAAYCPDDKRFKFSVEVYAFVLARRPEGRSPWGYQQRVIDEVQERFGMRICHAQLYKIWTKPQ
jgi:hypothetical protein